jgi:hypothetical protein
MERRSYSRANSMASVALAMLTLPSSAFAASGQFIDIRPRPPSRRSKIRHHGKPLHEQRWYSTMITLQDGRTLIGGGGVPYAISDAYQNPWWWLPDISVTPEVFTPGIGWTPMWHLWSLDAFGPTNNRGYYPRMWVAPDGTVFGISTEKVCSINLTSGTITTLRDFKTASKPMHFARSPGWSGPGHRRIYLCRQ